MVKKTTKQWNKLVNNIFFGGVQVKPIINQVNLASCCVMPPDMIEFAKLNDIQLLTHNDPPGEWYNHAKSLALILEDQHPVSCTSQG